MSIARWTRACLAMTGAAALLVLVGPTAEQLRAAATAPQSVVDTAGPDALLVAAAAAVAWSCWAWGALGLVLAGLSALPGAGGRMAGLLLLVVLPAGARRVAGVALGLSLAAGAPALSGTFPTATASVTASVPAGPAHSAASATSVPDPDWPVAPPSGAAADAGQSPGAAPDWPTGPPDQPGPVDRAAEHVVLRGDRLWDIAADALARQRPGAPVGNAEIAAEVHAWWQANAAVIGPDPDLLLPGQVLRAPR